VTPLAPLRPFFSILLTLAIFTPSRAQTIPYARSFAQPRPQIEESLKSLQAYSGQKLPILEGFVASGSKPLDRYERGFYQFSIELLPADQGATVVRLSAKITAWYADRDVAKSGYEVLPSNGRLELDLLDRLQEKLAGRPVHPPASSASPVEMPHAKLDLSGTAGGAISGPSASPIAKTPNEVAEIRNKRIIEERRVQQLSSELQNLREIQRNQAHPQSLVTVKSSVPIYSKPSDNARLLFHAAANDEFEFLDAADGWVHIEISGDARGYIQEGAVLLPERLVAKTLPTDAALDARFKGFRIDHQESSLFPGDWAPLKGKAVKIYTVQPVSPDPRETGPAARLNFTLALFQQASIEVSEASSKPEGVVVIFDAADGGIAGATLADIHSYADGSLTRDQFLARCRLDPDEAFRVQNK